MADYSDNAPDLDRFNFAHLDDTQFPLLENVDVYDYQNNFDYSRWADTTKIYLCNVLWNKDYSNVVKFKNDQKRDDYFDSIDNETVELTSAFHVAPDGTTKVPIPYQVATRYNYLYVDLPIMTSEEQPINYESTRRTQRFYYFIEDLAQNSPNSTTLIVSLDSWTTYINNVSIPYMMLERGHAPMECVDVETYLANPLQNNAMLLAPDVNFDDGTDIVRSAQFVPINNKAKYIIFATTMSERQLTDLKYPPTINTTNTPATFANADMRNGYQYIVNNYDWGIGDYNYDGLYTESTAFQSPNNRIPNNMTMIACASENAQTMFAYMSEHIPFFYKTVKACFMVDETMFIKGAVFTFCSVQCYFVQPAEDSVIAAINLNKKDFNYDEKYANITKLYTSPYARIEVTDNNGNIKEFKIENTSGLQVRQATALMFPYLSIQAYLTGVNGGGYNSYTWKEINGNTKEARMFSDDFGEYLWDWNVPTYALYVRGYDDAKASNYPRQALNRYNAVADYHKSTGMANTQYENAKDAANNTQTMTNNSAVAENTNARNMAATIQTNNNASASTAQSNTNASSNTAETNVNNQSTAARTNTARDCRRNRANTASRHIMQAEVLSHNNAMINANQKSDNALTFASASIDVQQTIITGVANAVGNVGSGVSGAASALGSLNPLGAIGNSVDMGLSVAETGISTWAAATASTQQAGVVIQVNNEKNNQGQENNRENLQSAVNADNKILAENNGAATDITNTTTNMWNTNADNTNNTNHANSKRTYDTSIANNTRTYNTSIGNADITKTNTETNAQLNATLTKNNANYTRNNTIDNAKITLEQARIANQYQYYGYRLNAPAEYGTIEGDPTLDAFERRGLQVKVRTQSNGKIAQAGDLMLRFGYALNQAWNVEQSGLNLMKHFTYWKAQDIWINDGEGVNAGAVNDIQRIFMNGVTVWNNPIEIGKVNIYDNWN